jgi:hypothetical protein
MIYTIWFWLGISIILISLPIILVCISHMSKEIGTILKPRPLPLKTSMDETLWAAEWHRYIGTPLIASFFCSILFSYWYSIITWDPWANYILIYGICLGVCSVVYLAIDMFWMHKYRTTHRYFLEGLARHLPTLLQ